MLLYLRHGDDRGDDHHRHDRHLNDRGRREAAERAGHLIEKYGHPDVAYVSPFRRALETLEAMTGRFERTVAVHRDPRVAQHLSERQQRMARESVSPETLAQVSLPEDDDTFRRRVRAHVEEVRRHADDVVWCVTHQAVIDEVADQFNVKISGNLDFLDYVVVRA